MEGILLINKPVGKTSFSLVRDLRRWTCVKKIGHGGTLDPLASGVMIFFIGRKYTRQAKTFLFSDKEYLATLCLGSTTPTYDAEGVKTFVSDTIPTYAMIEHALIPFQGTTEQIPPMFSAKKIGGKRLYALARQGIDIPRRPTAVTMHLAITDYTYPLLTLKIHCSKGTYIRSLAHDLGTALGTGAYLYALIRTALGPYTLEQCLEYTQAHENLSGSQRHPPAT